MEKLPGFNGADTLSKIARRAATAPGSDRLCVHFSNRLNALFSILSGLDADQWRSVIADYCNTACGFLQILRVQNGRDFLLFRLATSHEVASQIRQAHDRLDAIYQAIGVAEDERLAYGWRASWNDDRAYQDAFFANAVENTTAVALISEFKSPMKLEETLVALDKQIKVRQAAEPSEFGVSNRLFALMVATRDAVVRIVATRLPQELYEWFVLKDAVESERNAIGEGTFSEIYRAKWASPGRSGVVALKKLNKADDSATFSSEIAVWWGLKHRNILKMLGANHIVSRKFFVCEFADAGNFSDFFDGGANSKLLWSLFRQAAAGLAYLHSQSVEYGGLKCNNLLLHRENSGELVVKLSDFGLSRVRTQSVPVSVEEKQDDVRWKAPERLLQANEPINFFRADIYALGLCVIEAVTSETPFGMMDVEEIINFKLAQPPTPIERPDSGFIDDREWELVARMVDAAPENRPEIDEIIATMNDLDAIRQGGEHRAAIA